MLWRREITIIVTEAVKIMITDTMLNIKTIIITTISQGNVTMNIDVIGVKIIETTAVFNTQTIIIIGNKETIITTVVKGKSI